MSNETTSPLKKYVGVKEIQAVVSHKDSKEGYKVIYPQPDGTTYESWSPKDVFEKAYAEIDLDKQKVRELFCELVSETNKQEGIFLPQTYLCTLLNKMEEKKFTYSKE